MDSAFQWSRLRGFSGEIFLILGGTFFTRGAYFMVWPFLAVILFRDFGLTATTIGLMLTSAGAVGLLVGLFSGYLSDHIGRKAIVVGGALTSALAFILLSLARRPEAYALAITCCATGNALLESNGKAVIGDKITDLRTRELAYYCRYFLINVGAGVGPMVGAIFGLSARQSTFEITALIYGLYSVALFFLLKDEAQVHRRAAGPKLSFAAALGQVFKDRVFLILLLSNILVALVYASFDSTLVQYLTRSGVPHLVLLISTLVTVNAVTVVIGQFPVLKLLERFTPHRRILIGVSIMAVSQLLFALTPPAFLVGWVVATVVLSVGELIAFPTFSVEIDRTTPAHLRGTYFGASNLYSLGFSLAPILGGLGLDHIGGPALFACFSGLSVAVLALNARGPLSAAR
jgi:MFS family permease